jgi:hypothetical protein
MARMLVANFLDRDPACARLTARVEHHRDLVTAPMMYVDCFDAHCFTGLMAVGR